MNAKKLSCINTLRRLYIQALPQEAGAATQGKVLVDINRSPTARSPLWPQVFPELCVLIALRDPRDVVLSCYFQSPAQCHERKFSQLRAACISRQLCFNQQRHRTTQKEP
jgi:hypothetical protein